MVPLAGCSVEAASEWMAVSDLRPEATRESLVDWPAPARRLMERRRDWKLIYRDDQALIYARASAPAANLPGLPATANSVPGGFP